MQVEGPLAVAPSLVIPADELSWRFSRSSGPGGQGVNTTDSRVELSLDVAGSSAFTDTLRARAIERLGDRLTADGVLTVTASEHRSQRRNREAARARMLAVLREATAPPARARRPSRPTAAARQRRLESKRRRAEVKFLRGRIRGE
jgi:ribosome-associated protein